MGQGSQLVNCSKLKVLRWNKQQNFLGIDVSKPFFDVALIAVVNHEKQAIMLGHFDYNDSRFGYICFLTKLHFCIIQTIEI